MRKHKTCYSDSATITVTIAGGSENYQGFHMEAEELEKNVNELEYTRTKALNALYQSIKSICFLLETDGPAALQKQLKETQVTDEKRLELTQKLDEWKLRTLKAEGDFQKQLLDVLEVIRRNRCSILESSLQNELRQEILIKKKEIESLENQKSYRYQILINQINELWSIKKQEQKANKCCEEMETLESELRLFAENLEAVKDKDPITGIYYQELKKLFQYLRFCT